MWTLVVAVDFFLMSNPLVFVAGMDRALTIAVMVTGLAVTITLPWARAPRIAWPVLLFLGWLLLSSTWSIQPSFTLAAWAQTAAVAFVAVVIYANVTARVLVFGFVLGGVAVSAASVYAFHERLPGSFNAPLNEDVIAGIGTNQNILAYTLTLSLCGLCAALPRRAWGRVLWAAAAGAIGYGLVVADSATGDLTMAAVIIAAVLLSSYEPVTRRFIRTTGHRVVMMIAMAAVAAVVCLWVMDLLGQDLLTFSDRTPLWSATLTVAQERPFVGFGYGAVWQHPWKPPLLNIVLGDIWDRSGYPLAHGHNSAIDLVVEIGLVGVLLMILVMVAAACRSVTLMRSRAPGADDALMGRFILLCLVNLAVFGITEPMATIPLGWWALVLLTEPARPGALGLQAGKSMALKTRPSRLGGARRSQP